MATNSKHPRYSTACIVILLLCNIIFFLYWRASDISTTSRRFLAQGSSTHDYQNGSTPKNVHHGYSTNFNPQLQTEVLRGNFEPCIHGGDQTITDLFLRKELGWSKPPPDWVKDNCPEVIKHYQKFPSFKNFVSYANNLLPISTTDYAVKGVCTLKLVQELALSVDAMMLISHGSHLGAVRHGQPIPWDDDIDVLVPLEDKVAILEACTNRSIHSTAKMHCVETSVSIKIYVDYNGKEEKFGRFWWKSPFVDLFFFKIEGEQVKQLEPGGELSTPPEGCLTKHFFPLGLVYFAGFYVMAPNPAAVTEQYQLNICQTGFWNHHHQAAVEIGELELDCCQLSKIFPFTYENGIIYNGREKLTIDA